MAKRKKIEQPESAWDDALDAAITEAKKLYPNRVYTGSEESMRSICLTVPFSVRCLLQQEGWPLGRFVLLAGPQESCKSAMSYEIIRWHRQASGMGVIIEVEDKRSPELCQSILNYDERAVQVHRCETMEDWNSALSYWLDKIKVLMDGDPKAPKARPGKGRVSPFAFVVDSIMAAVVEDVMASVSEEGHTGKRYALEAGQLSDYLKVATKWLSDYPFSLIGINHNKPGQDRYGNPVRKLPGGKAPGYHASLDIDMNRVGKQWKMADGREGITLRMDIMKNSSAPHASVEVDMVWYMDINNPTEAGECLQRTYFDWDTAAIELLRKAMQDPGVSRRKKLEELVGLHCTDSTKKCWSDQLDIPEDEPLSYAEAGKVLEAKIDSDQAFRDALYPLMGIRRRVLYRPSVDYREQMKDAQEVARDMQKHREKYVTEHIKTEAAPKVGVLDEIFENMPSGKPEESPVEIG